VLERFSLSLILPNITRRASHMHSKLVALSAAPLLHFHG
jgi:hypothetical protein